MKYVKLITTDGDNDKNDTTRWFDPTQICMISPSMEGETGTCVLHLGNDRGGRWKVKGNPEAIAQILEIARRA